PQGGDAALADSERDQASLSRESAPRRPLQKTPSLMGESATALASTASTKVSAPAWPLGASRTPCPTTPPPAGAAAHPLAQRIRRLHEQAAPALRSGLASQARILELEVDAMVEGRSRGRDLRHCLFDVPGRREHEARRRAAAAELRQVAPSLRAAVEEVCALSELADLAEQAAHELDELEGDMQVLNAQLLHDLPEHLLHALVDLRAGAGARSGNVDNMLQWAVEKGRRDIVDFVRKQDLGEAEEGQLPRTYQELLHQIERFGWDRMQWKDGFTMLHWAADKGQERLCLYLTRLGADLRARDGRGRTPLDCALAAGHRGAAQVLQGSLLVEPASLAAAR
ncbi:unnamed protein product, partial [Prorocentrum cordatum]